MPKIKERDRSSILWSDITIPDNTVVSAQTTGTGHGEGKLYIASRNDELFLKFINQSELNRSSPFKLKCYFRKHELMIFLEELKFEYKNPQQNYKKSRELPLLFEERKKLLSEEDDQIFFTIAEQPQIKGTRLYVNSKDKGYQLMRQLALPYLSYLALRKEKQGDGALVYHARLFVDFSRFGNEVFHPSTILKKDNTPTLQSKFREKVMRSSLFCPVTKVSDERLLEAAHIKPKHLIDEDDPDRWDGHNGILFTPTIHKLYDQGFITIKDEFLKTSPWLSELTYKKLNLVDGMKIEIPEQDKRKRFFQFHNDYIFKA